MHPASQRKYEDTVRYGVLGGTYNVTKPEDCPQETPLHFPWRESTRDELV